MSPTFELEQGSAVHDVPKLTVEWSSRWREFVESIGPALSRSEARLAGEAPFGLIPLRIMLPSYVVEGFVILSAIFLQAKIAELRPYVVQRIPSHDVIYYSGDELPRTEDLGGSETAKSGTAGGNEAHHRTQTIKIARGGSAVSKVVDAPNLKLPTSNNAVANLLAIRPDPGPPPAEGLRSVRSAPNLSTAIVAPSPNVVRDYTRNGIALESVVAPAPNVTRDRPLTAPSLSTTLIPPAPNVTNDHTLVAPALAPSVVPPSPRVTRDHAGAVPSLNTGVVAPSPTVPSDPFRAKPSVASNVIPPAPGSVSRQISSAPVQMAAVVPPPVSAPEQAGLRNSKLSLPAPSLVAPPPSTDISSDMRRINAGSLPDPAKSVVPPPPSQSGSPSLVSSLIGKIFGAQEVVPPPPSVNSKSSAGGAAPSLASNVVPPPPPVDTNSNGGTPRGSRNGSGTSPGSTVVAPPPSFGMNGGTGNRTGAGSAPYLGNPSVVPPPPNLSGPGGGTGSNGGGAGAPGGLLASNVVPPPPSLGSGVSASGTGAGRKRIGIGAPTDIGSNVAPPNTAGSGKEAGTIVSNQPGTKVGLPPTSGKGSLAMSPTGGDKTGLGAAGGGTGIGHGPGNGSAVEGSGSGAAKSGAGLGADPNAHGGISPSNGTGGAGNSPSGTTPPVRGVDISGGSGIVTLPSFGTDPGAPADAAPTSRTSLKPRTQTLGVTVVATATSGGAFEPYKKLLHGDIYTTYFDTSVGTVVMEFADEAAANHGFGGTIGAPVALRSDLPEGIPRARMLIACTLDASGNVRNPKVLEPGPAAMTAKVMAAIRSWKFEPAMKNNQPTDVTAILGFGIDTNDRF